MIRTALMLVGLVLTLGLARAQDGPSDEDLQRAWGKLGVEQKTELVAWFQAELDRRDSFQNQLMRHVFYSLDHGRRKWPSAERPPAFDAAKHCPAQVIPRKYGKVASKAQRREAERMFADVAERPIDSAWRYDWARGTVVRDGDPDDPDRIFRNALAGAPPELDLAEAILIGLLDDGSLRAEHQAFGHVYAHRDGTAFSAITLYDAWCSGLELEMPDVECLGIVHTLSDDWKTWVAPVRSAQQNALYARVGEWFQPLRRQRGLITALARSYLQADPVMRDGYGHTLPRMHGIWEHHVSDPAKLRAHLPAPDPDRAWRAWFKDQDKIVKRDKDLAGRAASRQATLRREGLEVRAVLVAVLRESGALD